MPLQIDTPPAAGPAANVNTSRSRATPQVVVGLINNMPDAALEGTEAQFRGLLQAAAGPISVRLRFSYLPEVPRAPAALEHLSRFYWPLDDLLDGPLDALIVTGTEPKARVLSEEPYWRPFVRLLEWAEAHTVSSLWSCLAAHAAVEHLDGVQRQRLERKRFGVFEHRILSGNPLLRGVRDPLHIPHSRWNELPLSALQSAGYTIISRSGETGADLFTKQARSLLVFCQGHPEYEDTTLLKEYRRDVGRFLRAEQSHYPTLPCGYFDAEALALLSTFQSQAQRQRDPELLSQFPTAALARSVRATWRPAATRIYTNWLGIISTATASTAPRVISSTTVQQF